jgi:hypothetical protein
LVEVVVCFQLGVAIGFSVVVSVDVWKRQVSK